jgi:hypothetical protein
MSRSAAGKREFHLKLQSEKPIQVPFSGSECQFVPKRIHTSRIA